MITRMYLNPLFCLAIDCTSTKSATIVDICQTPPPVEAHLFDNAVNEAIGKILL